MICLQDSSEIIARMQTLSNTFQTQTKNKTKKKDRLTHPLESDYWIIKKKKKKKN